MNSPQDDHADSEEERALARVGRTIKGKWMLESLLGVGGMAAVYAAQHRNGQRSALKILHTEYARDKLVCERFLREAYVSNTVNHPACVKIVDDDLTEDEEPFLVMELLEGETVRDAWKATGRVMAVPQVLHIADRVLDCLAACHALGIIHRDLKPANLFLTTTGEVKVLDFGVAQMRSATAERTAAGTALGTPAYMSPEQAMGLVDQLDGRADLFSVGAMIHALVTGQRLNNGRTEQEALVMAATTPAPSVARIAPHLPVVVIALIDKALAWDRRNRYADAHEMQVAVNEALDVIVGPREEPPPRAPPPRPRMKSGLHLETHAPPVIAAQHAQTVGRMPVAAISGAAFEAVVPENDPRVEKARDLFRHVERVLPNVRQLGWDHPRQARKYKATLLNSINRLP